ncbi:hypothetical protein [Streptomyces sp. NPDC016845]|uniref:hypothetical protein n=1 Tax=Streptomyces sp. NPDC016845 TaxID=3364972 RepID=UPI00378ACD47
MTVASKHCPNCGNSIQKFRTLTADELTSVAATVGHGRADAWNYRRCSHEGCLRVQRHFKADDGFNLPESFR